MNSLQDRRALVTGASSGIGAATALALSEAGARVWLLARNPERLAQVAARCKGAQTLAVDVRDGAAVAQALSNLEFDIAVNNAGLALGVDKLPAGNIADWSTVIDTNVKGVLHVARAVLPGMQQRGRGDHVLLGSVAGRQIYPGGNIYCATKHAVRALYEALRLDMAGSGVRHATVDPGMVLTDFSRVRFQGDDARAQAVYNGMTPLQPADVADAIVWLLSRPPHVNVGELVLWPTDQASTTQVTRRT